MDSENTQLKLLEERIEYDEKIFGSKVKYYGFSDSNMNYVYTSVENPKANDMTYLYENEKMVENKIIDSVTEISNITQSIVIEDITYDATDSIISIPETYLNVLNRLLEDSKYVALSIRYPYQDFSNMELPSKYKNWQLRCCQEIYNGIGTEGIKSYSENGLSWTRDSGYISYELRSEIESMVGYIQEEPEEVEELTDTEMEG